jgi:S-adenosylmethionine decarboxylase proenzyme
VKIFAGAEVIFLAMTPVNLHIGRSSTRLGHLLVGEDGPCRTFKPSFNWGWTWIQIQAPPRGLSQASVDPARPPKRPRKTISSNAAQATLLHVHLHHFTPNQGISGVAVLAESHISIHTWPENGYAALDVFMCGGAEPQATIEVLRAAFKPDRLAVEEILRGHAG